MRFKFLIVLCFSVFALSGCAETQLASHAIKNLPGMGASKSVGRFKVGKPYTVKGRRYYPRETYNHTETGIASWYGPNFHGKKTANGEIFNMNELTAAHKTLQLPSLVRVTNLENGRSIIVRINDRGPFKHGRIIDLSKRAAELLDFKHQGTAKVKLQVLTKESMEIAERAKRGQDTRGLEVAANEGRLRMREPITTQKVALKTPQPAETSTREQLPPKVIPGELKNGNFVPDPIVNEVPVSKTNIYVQAGSFGDRANAQILAQQLQKYGAAKVYPTNVNGQNFYRVRFGPTKSVAAADNILNNLSYGGHDNAIIVVE